MDSTFACLQTSKMLKCFTTSSLHQDRSAAVICERYNDTDSEEKLEEEKMLALTCISGLCNMGASLGPSAIPCLWDVNMEEIDRFFCAQPLKMPWRSNKSYVSILSREQHMFMHCSLLAIGGVFWHRVPAFSPPSLSAKKILTPRHLCNVTSLSNTSYQKTEL